MIKRIGLNIFFGIATNYFLKNWRFIAYLSQDNEIKDKQLFLSDIFFEIFTYLGRFMKGISGRYLCKFPIGKLFPQQTFWLRNKVGKDQSLHRKAISN